MVYILMGWKLLKKLYDNLTNIKFKSSSIHSVENLQYLASELMLKQWWNSRSEVRGIVNYQFLIALKFKYLDTHVSWKTVFGTGILWFTNFKTIEITSIIWIASKYEGRKVALGDWLRQLDHFTLFLHTLFIRPQVRNCIKDARYFIYFLN